MNKKFVIQVCVCSIIISAVLSFTGCSKAPEEQVQTQPAEPDKYAKVVDYSTPAPEPVPEAAAAEPTPAPEPDPVEEKPKPWAGRCYSGDNQIWAGNATNFAGGNCAGGSSGCTEFDDASTGKRVQIEGQFTCIWNKPEGA